MEANLRRPDADTGNRIGSVRFLVGSIAVAGRIDENRYERPPDARFGTLLEKIRLSFEPGRPIRYVRIEVSMTDCTRHVAEADDHAFAPADPHDWLAEGGRHVLSDDKVRELTERLTALERQDDLSEVMACMVPDV